MVQYLDDPDCTYIVVENPWPGLLSGAQRRNPKHHYFEFMGAWIFFMLDKKTSPHTIYSVDTRTEVIVGLPAGTDVTFILGVHKWRKFLNLPGVPDDRASYIFEYNYKNNGHPDDHNWLANILRCRGIEPPPHMNFPIKYPYPPASWASRSGRGYENLVKPLPSTRTRTPTPPPTPPPQEVRTASSPPGRTSAPKLDPYEEDNAALQALKQEHIGPRLSMETKPDVIKKEEFKEDEPSKALVLAIERYQQRQIAESQLVKPEPQAEEPRRDLLDAIDRPKRKRELEAQVDTQGLGPHDRRAVVVKSEAVDTGIPPPSVLPIKVKPEPEDTLRLSPRRDEYHAPSSQFSRPRRPSPHSPDRERYKRARR